MEEIAPTFSGKHADAVNASEAAEQGHAGPTLEETNKSYWDRLWPVIACGAGLFSDG